MSSLAAFGCKLWLDCFELDGSRALDPIDVMLSAGWSVF
jgi:hypothetical protein